MTWTWRFETRAGRELAPAGISTEGFPTQSDAESWLGEDWRLLLEAGVDQVHLLEDGIPVYGPMSLHPD